jgi:ubiquinone/menaquinone biosynthesis C-methylase UbiE
MKPDYGIDAPNVVRNLFLFSLILAALAGFSFLIQGPVWFWIAFLYTFPTSLALFITGCWMLYGIKVTKPRTLLHMIQRLELKGHETVLDLGCGRGLLLCKIAQYLPQGMAYGIDLWSTKDQSGNSAEQTLQNADREGVKTRVTVQTGDVCSLSFPDNSFDVIVSSLCLHNIKDKEQRGKALSEMLRVLKPGGKFAIADIQRSKEYADFLSAKGAHVECSKPTYAYCPPITIVEGTK